MADKPKQTAANSAGLQDDHDPGDTGQRVASNKKQQQSQMEGPAAYAPHNDEDADSTKRKADG